MKNVVVISKAKVDGTNYRMIFDGFVYRVQIKDLNYYSKKPKKAVPKYVWIDEDDDGKKLTATTLDKAIKLFLKMIERTVDFSISETDVEDRIKALRKMKRGEK